MDTSNSSADALCQRETNPPDKDSSVKKQKAKPTVWKIATSVLAYAIIHTAMVTEYKRCLKETNVPLTFLWVQFVLGTAVMACGSLFFALPSPLDKSIVRQVGPYALLNGIGLVAYTVALKKLDAIMGQIARGLVLPLTAVIGHFFLSRPLDGQTASACALFVLGFGVGVLGDALKDDGELKRSTTASQITICYGIFAALIKTCQSLMIRFTLRRYRAESFADLPFLYNAYQSVLLAPVVLVEWAKLRVLMQEPGKFARLGRNIVSSGILGLLYNLAMFNQLSLITPLSYVIATLCKTSILLVGLSWRLGERLSMSRLVSTFTMLGASCWYWTLRAHQRQQQSQSTEAKEKDLTVLLA